MNPFNTLFELLGPYGTVAFLIAAATIAVILEFA